MSKPLHLFKKPPYTGWTLIHGYGADPTNPSVMHSHLLFEKTGTAQVLAATTGKLSMRQPRAGTLEANEEIVLPAQNEPLPQTVTLYLHTWPTTLAINPLFRSRAREINDINGFAYLNIATSSLEAGLADVLDSAAIPRGTLTRTQIVERFVRGGLDLFVPVGHVIGEASVEGAPSGSVRLGFTVLTNCGPLDPSYVYDWMRDFVEDGQPELDAFLVLAPKTWPVIDPNLSADAVVTLTESTLYSWHVLHSLKTSRNLDAVWRDEGGTNKSLWRLVGNNQKALWRERLLMRTGHPATGSTAPPFEFDDMDWQNLFQLEAVTEFYANFDDPWLSGAIPRNSSVAGYITLDFLNPSGAAATASGNVVTLDGNPDLTRVRQYHNFTTGSNQFRDTIFLESDTARTSKMYKITARDNVAKTVTLDAAPTLTGGTSGWEIKLRTVSVIIDSFGGRLKGNAATAAAAVLTLDGTPNLSKVNENFDTIYLPSDIARASRTYRITSVDDAADTVMVDAAPTLDGGSSTWHIQSGISGELPAMDYRLGPGGTKGYDHYEGVAFVLRDGEIYQKIRYGSFTSRNYAAGSQLLSSIRGNRTYDFMSFCSNDSDVRNYCFRVTDPGASYDGVREARFYFSTPVTDDSVPVGQNPNGGGKTLIRIHYGNHDKTGSGSAGCLVSPIFQDVRDSLIERYQDEYVALNGPPQDAEVQKAHGKDLAHSQILWAKAGADGLTGGNWDDKIVGTFWVIRPDERHL